MATMCSLDLPDIIKPISDYRKYRYLCLENGLRAILVSDLKPGEAPCKLEVSATNDKSSDLNGQDVDLSKDAPVVVEGSSEETIVAKELNEDTRDVNENQKAAACLTVGAGSFSDPVDCQGLAHYLEHMVFMGSAKYPEEDDFHSFIAQRGGRTNAFTQAKETCFYFTVRPKYFHETLDRFANFFIAPLLKKDSMDKERTAVHSEYEMHRNNDEFRKRGLHAHLSHPENPFSKFDCGSKKSLEEIPESRGVDIYSCLQQFRRDMYSAGRMTLAVIAKQSLSYLEEMVRSIFSEVPNNGKPAPDFSQHGLPLRPESIGKLYKVCPSNAPDSLYIHWDLPSLYPRYKSHPLNICAYLIGHESAGSIISLLRKLGLAVELMAGTVLSDCRMSNEMLEQFGIHIVLTENGLANYEEVIKLVFQYINMLRVTSISTDVLDEYRILREDTFKHSSLSAPCNAVMHLGRTMQRVDDLNWLLAFPYLDEGAFDSEKFHEALSCMQAEKAVFILSSKQFSKECTQVEEWYGCQFTTCDIQPEKLSSWNVSQPPPLLHLPKKNIFLAKNFDVLPIEDPSDVPKDLTNELPENGADYGVLYHKMDQHFQKPKAITYFTLWSPAPMASPKNVLLHSLLIYAANQNLLDISYFAMEAGLSYTIGGTFSCYISCSGFSDTIFKLYDAILCALRDFTITESQFETYKGLFKQRLSLASLKPEALVKEVEMYLISSPNVISNELLLSLRDLTVEDLRSYHQTLFSDMRISAYVHGNLSAQQAKDFFMHTVKTFKFKPIPPVKRLRMRQLPQGDVCARMYNMNHDDVNTVVLNVFQIGPLDIFKCCVLEVLSSILSKSAFNYLRTKEQLGYVVHLYPAQDHGIGYLSLLVVSQTDKFPLHHCYKKMEYFLTENAQEIISTISDTDLMEYIKSAISNRKMEDTSMHVAANRIQRELITEEFVFDRRQKEIQVLQSMTRSDLQKMLESFVCSSSTRSHLSLQVESCKNDSIPSELRPIPLQDEWQLRINICPSTNDDDVTDSSTGATWINDLSICEQWPLYEEHKIIS